ncbi:MAG: replication-associated recombination protein A [Planctomycetes bacterium]|nr:replication-associated recombination protein A [Planctomycetota bacterium]
MRPLADRIRPQSLDEIVGHPSLLGANGVLRRWIEARRLPSLVLWGPPGCGKTTIARLLAEALGFRFASFSAVLGGVPELRALLEEARTQRAHGVETLLFIDELHRFHKGQQDALLPHIESGAITFIGATTENPSFALNRALASRLRILNLGPLSDEDLRQLIARARSHPAGLPDLILEPAAEEAAVRWAAGDGRRLLNILEAAHALAAGPLTVQTVAAVCQHATPDHDRAGEAHYDTASAFIKSMRASDVQAALFWLARQLEAGEDPLFVARRLLIFAAEDVGLADPQALVIAAAAHYAAAALGMPEAVYPLTEATIYCATAPKSNGTAAYFAAATAVRQHPQAAVPLFLRNAPTALMQSWGYGAGYINDHDTPDHFAGHVCLPPELAGSIFYRPGSFGFEKEIAKRLRWWEARRRAQPTTEGSPGVPLPTPPTPPPRSSADQP